MGAILVAVYCTDHVRSQGNKLEWAPIELAIQGNLIINKITIIIDYDAMNFFYYNSVLLEKVAGGRILKGGKCIILTQIALLNTKSRLPF